MVEQVIGEVVLGLLCEAVCGVIGITVCFVLPIMVCVAPFWAMLRSWQALQASRLLPHLQAKGWSWLTHADARLLYRRLGNRAFSIPPYEDVAVLPGYWQDDVRTVVLVIQQVDWWRRWY